MIRLRSFVIFSSVLVVCLAILGSWLQMKRLLEQGALTLEEKELDHISQVVRTAIETKKSELRNYTQMIRNNNDLSSAYLIAKESGDIDLIDAKLGKIKNEIHFDFSEIVTLEGTPIHSPGLALEPGALKRILIEKEGLFPGQLDGKPALIAFSPLTLYDEPIAIFVMSYFPEESISKDLSKLANADVTFNTTGPSGASGPRAADPTHGRLSFKIEGTDRDQLWATINLKGNPAESFWRPFSTRLLLSGAISLAVLLLLLYCFLELGFMRGFRNFVDEVKKVSQDVDRGEPRELPVVPSRIFENNLLFQATQKLVTSLIAHEERMKQQVLLREAAEKQKALGELASQVAHDIRSPLSALLMATSSLTQIPEPNRLLIRGAISRIQDIANNLLTKRREIESGELSKTAVPSVVSDGPSVQLLSSLIESIVSEKRMQTRQRFQTRIEMRIDQSSYGLFANVQPSAFKTIISNLLDNSLEAIDSTGNILVCLQEKSAAVEVSIEDNGKGIPDELLPKLAQRGVSFNKKEGSGLGLFHARTNVEAWGGSIKISSEVAVGTKVALVLPKAKPPRWFVPGIEFPDGHTVVVVDDDVSIHQIWEKRFEELDGAGPRATLVHFSAPQQLLDWKPSNTETQNTLYLVDYEFLGESENGLSLIERLGIESRSILVTSRYEEMKIVERCQTRNIRLIPKGMAGFVPIHSSPRSA